VFAGADYFQPSGIMIRFTFFGYLYFEERYLRTGIAPYAWSRGIDL